MVFKSIYLRDIQNYQDPLEAVLGKPLMTEIKQGGLAQR